MEDMIRVEGVKVYDPRDNQYKLSSNPALIMAYFATERIIFTDWRLHLDSEFWLSICNLADYCDGLDYKYK